MVSGCRIAVRGIVQGVGFRPFVYALALRHNLKGWVRNTSAGVEIEVHGQVESIQLFVNSLRNGHPPLAQIDSVESKTIDPADYTSFVIETSQPAPDDYLPISPDVSICPECLQEMLSPDDRRYHYPFINCTNCGPRFSIITDIPYDRPNTTMADFPMCPECQAEYDNPANRRFHAQPVACAKCGPQVWFEVNSEKLAYREDAISKARQWLADGRILAIKGLGGFHLACDAHNHAAVTELRQRKGRSDKPFALMAHDLATIERHCEVSSAEKDLLQSAAHPIVLLERKPESTLAKDLAPNLHTLGFMLPYTPLHVLLLEPSERYPEVLVMTSGNLSEEPIAYQDFDARERLSGIADGFLLHDRPIHMRVDDSVTTTVLDQPYLHRRARGYAPQPIRLAQSIPPLLATGAELKNTFCLGRDRYAFLSHHIGDMQNFETLQSFEQGVDHYERLFRVKPQLIACDLHPDYLASRYARQRAAQSNLPVIEVQHHHAHLAACLADNQWHTGEPVIGLSLDGTGMGTDGAIWGGEVLVGDYSGYERRFHLRYVRQAGGDLSVRRPARMALAHLEAAGIEWEPDLPPVESLCYEERTALRAQLLLGLNAPYTSSMGRLFDAAAALIGLRYEATYEAQAAIELEAIVHPDETGRWDFELDGENIDPTPLWHSLLAEWRNGTSLSVLSAKFHNSIAWLMVQICSSIRQRDGLNTVALSGGVWQNKVLLLKSLQVLKSEHFNVLYHQRVPTNDGGLALGQAMIAAALHAKE